MRKTVAKSRYYTQYAKEYEVEYVQRKHFLNRKRPLLWTRENEIRFQMNERTSPAQLEIGNASLMVCTVTLFNDQLSIYGCIIATIHINTLQTLKPNTT